MYDGLPSQTMYPNLTSVFSFSGIAIPHWYPRCKNKSVDDGAASMFYSKNNQRCYINYIIYWLWSFNNEYDAMRNKMTMVYGFTCLLCTPRLSPRSIMYSVFGVAGFGVIVKWMWWNVNRDYLLYLQSIIIIVWS